MADREKNRAELANRSTDSVGAQRLAQQAKEAVFPELRLSERVRAHKELLRRPTETTTVGSTDNTPYWKAQAVNVHLDVRSHNKQQELNRMFVMNSAKPTEIDWQATYQARRRECDVYKNRGGK